MSDEQGRTSPVGHRPARERRAPRRRAGRFRGHYREEFVRYPGRRLLKHRIRRGSTRLPSQAGGQGHGGTAGKRKEQGKAGAGRDGEAVRVALAALLGIALLGLLVVDLSGGDAGGRPSGGAQSTVVSEFELMQRANTFDHPVYWLGPRPGSARYELEINRANRSALRIDAALPTRLPLRRGIHLQPGIAGPAALRAALQTWEAATRLVSLPMLALLLLAVAAPWLLSGRARSGAILFAATALILLFFPIVSKSYDYRFVVPAYAPLAAAAALSGWGLARRLRA
jgi:hypothetical protein